MRPAGFPSTPSSGWLGAFLATVFLVFNHGLSPVASAQTEPLACLKAFSELGLVDPRKLLAGEIQGLPGAAMDFPKGFWSETCFAVPVSPGEVARRLQIWDPSLHPTLKAIAFHPVSQPCQAAEFEPLSFLAGNRPLRWLLDKSMATTPLKSELHLSRAEAQQLGARVKGKPAPAAVADCWKNILLERATTFQREGFAGLAPYEVSGEAISPLECLRAMMRERPAMVLEFQPLLRRSGLMGDPKPGAGTLQSFHYWGAYEINYHGTLTLGVLYLLPVGDRYQLLDAQYYVSGTYYTSVTLYEVWPIPAGDRTGSLVWRGDFFAAPSLAYMKGVERLAYGAVVLQDLKKSIRLFQEDLRRPAPGDAAPQAP